MIKLFGIPNCDTVKKARTFLEKGKHAYEFVDFKKVKPTVADLVRWKAAFGEWPVNKQGLTFKKHKETYEKLPEAKRPAFICENASMIKRPILERDGVVLAFGFDAGEYKEKL